MSGRTTQILSRLPAHLEPTRPGKLLGAVVEALSSDLDVLSADMASIRRAHRIAHADTLQDLLRIGALHNIDPRELAALFRRFAQARAVLSDLRSALDALSDPALAEEAAGEVANSIETFCALWGLNAPIPRFPLYLPADSSTPPSPEEVTSAGSLFLTLAADATSYRTLLEAARTRILKVCQIHAVGNGTVRALMEGAANALDLDLGTLQHSDDRLWHVATVRDRLRLSRPYSAEEIALGMTPPGTVVGTPVALDPADELLVLEENPTREASHGPTQRFDGSLFTLLRRGFNTVPLEIQLGGLVNQTYCPCLVNMNEGWGMGYAGVVPADYALVFTREGKAFLRQGDSGGQDVTPDCYLWRGACFAEEGALPGHCFLFADEQATGDTQVPRPACFAGPAVEIELETLTEPYLQETLPPATLGLGEIRFAFMVLSPPIEEEDGGGNESLVNKGEGEAEQSALANPGDDGTGEGEPILPESTVVIEPPASMVGLEWDEHEAYTVRLRIPSRFQALDASRPEGEPELLQRVAAALERFRPMGIQVQVAYQPTTQPWVLGEGVLDGDLLTQLTADMILGA